MRGPPRRATCPRVSGQISCDTNCASSDWQACSTCHGLSDDQAVSPFELTVDGVGLVLQGPGCSGFDCGWWDMPTVVSTGQLCHGSGPTRNYLDCPGLFTFSVGQTAQGSWWEGRMQQSIESNSGVLVVNVYGLPVISQ